MKRRIFKIVVTCAVIINLLTGVNFAESNNSENMKIINIVPFTETQGQSVTLSKEIKDVPNYILDFNEKKIAVFTDSISLKTQKEVKALELFLIEVEKNKQSTSKNEFINTEAFEVVLVDEEKTYIYIESDQCSPSVKIDNTLKKSEKSINTASKENYASMMTAATSIDLSKGIGARAFTAANSSASYINVSLYAGIPNYSTSIPDINEKKGTEINFFNYLGFSYGGIESDLGLIYSYTYGGWRIYGKVVDGLNSYFHDTPYNTGSVDIGFKYSGSSRIGIKVEKYYLYNNNSRVRMTVNGTQTTGVSGTSVLIMPRGVSSNVRYKVLSTISTPLLESNIKYNTSITNLYKDINLAGTTIGSFAALESDEATINYSGGTLSMSLKKN